MPHPLYVVDAFTDRPFAGNPAAVCVLGGEFPSDDWLQRVGAEMNLSETAFLAPHPEGWRLRWFTPTVEVDLCGHATLASAHVLWETGRLPADATARFLTRSGWLAATRTAEGIEMDFPAVTPAACPDDVGLADRLGVRVRHLARNRMDYLAELESEEAVRALKPDFAALAALPVRGVIVTARSGTEGFDFVSRFFAPAAGVAEDPVTGSAHCCLGPYWGAKLGRVLLRGYQASARGGAVMVRLQGERVRLGGKAVTVSRGELCV
jgi:PhzF family phenazine biosynthesis protein